MVLTKGPIGVFDSGYGGLTILNEFRKLLPEYDYLYLGDNARTPYGNRSFDTVYEYTLEAVRYLFSMNCPLIIIACNTASSKALRNIQQKYLPFNYPERRVLGIIRPTVEVLADLSKTKHVGILGTAGTVNSESYNIEVSKLYPDIKISSEPCPMWVPIVENSEIGSEGARYFVKENIDNIFCKDPEIDTLLLGCTHYPLLLPVIKQFVPATVKIISQGKYVAESLISYLSRHTDIEEACLKGGGCKYLTTESPYKFEETAHNFIKETVKAFHISLL